MINKEFNSIYQRFITHFAHIDTRYETRSTFSRALPEILSAVNVVSADGDAQWDGRGEGGAAGGHLSLQRDGRVGQGPGDRVEYKKLLYDFLTFG